VNRCPPKPVIAGNVPPPRVAFTNAVFVKFAIPETSITPQPFIEIVEDTIKLPVTMTGHMIGFEGEEIVTSELTTQFPFVHTAPVNGIGHVPVVHELNPHAA